MKYICLTTANVKKIKGKAPWKIAVDLEFVVFNQYKWLLFFFSIFGILFNTKPAEPGIQNFQLPTSNFQLQTSNLNPAT
jgi:hypothetical protein